MSGSLRKKTNIKKEMKSLKADSINELTRERFSIVAKIDSDVYPSHCKQGKVASEVTVKVVKPKETTKALLWIPRPLPMCIVCTET